MSNPHLRCAIYTRKSSDEGLDQEFNSLDAQHEACAAYISSQKNEGWRLVPQRYDDGGISGGTLDRPALRSLMGEIDAGRIDMIVVYKIDRLTRSLADFSKLVERLEAASCSFVSVTQAFNTSSSMGRLTLNVLLSFAQFEREVTAERIRDKIAASKKKGLWMGGVPPLGYDPHPDKTRRELVVIEAEAEVVRQIFDLYASQRCLNAVIRAAQDRGLRSKRHAFTTGRVQGGNPFSRGQIWHILTNPVYLGRIRHRDKTYPGTHPAIIDQDLWDNVQAQMQSASARKRGARPGQSWQGPAPLLGKLRDETGDRLTPSHTNRRGKRLRYYISNRLISGGTDPTGWRLPAQDLETAVARAVAAHLSDSASRHAVLRDVDAGSSTSATLAIEECADRIRSDGIAVVAPLITLVTLGNGRLTLGLDLPALAAVTDRPVADLDPRLAVIDIPFTCRRRGVEVKIIAGERAAVRDTTLIRGLRHAHRWSTALKSGTPLGKLAADVGYSERYMARVIPLVGLSPRIQTAIIAGGQPVDLTLERLIRGPLPLDWQDQEKTLGFDLTALP